MHVGADVLESVPFELVVGRPDQKDLDDREQDECRAEGESHCGVAVDGQLLVVAPEERDIVDLRKRAVAPEEDEHRVGQHGKEPETDELEGVFFENLRKVRLRGKLNF